MNYKVLYRKYRPDRFSNIVGQDYSIQMLRNAIINDKISHAYLFTGPRGTGKTSTARVFAKTINCLNPIDGEACGECKNCLSFANSPDIIEIDAASNNGVDDIRELISNVKVAPSESKYKIYIIDEVHMMTTSAFNALLLTLEEPPKHAIFIMATTNVENVPITILSRCQRFNFQKISLDNLKKQISYVCSEEKIQITEAAIEEIAYLSEGGLRDALSLLDQLSSNGEEITVDKILENYGSISSKFIKDLLNDLGEKNIDKVIQRIQSLENTSSDYKIFIKKIVQELSHIAVLIKVGSYNGAFQFKQVKDMIFEFNSILNKINININPYHLIQLVLLNSLDDVKQDFQVSEISSKTVDKKLDVSSKNISASPVVITDSKQSENGEISLKFLQKLKEIRVNNCFYGAKKDWLLKYQDTWIKIADDINLSPDLLAFVVDSSIVAASEDYLIVTTKLDSTANIMNTKLTEIEANVKNYFSCPIHLVALSQNEWQAEKKQYVQNLKNKYVYEFIPEDILNELKPKEVTEIEEISTNVFDCDKIEIV